MLLYRIANVLRIFFPLFLFPVCQRTRKPRAKFVKLVWRKHFRGAAVILQTMLLLLVMDYNPTGRLSESLLHHRNIVQYFIYAKIVYIQLVNKMIYNIGKDTIFSIYILPLVE